MIDEKQMMIGCIERLNESVKRLQTALEASRKNEQTAREERDAALVKISKVAEACEAAGSDVSSFREDIQKILGVCSICGTLGRLGDAPCTHLG